MPLTVVVEPLASGGFSAVSGDPIHLEARGDTRADALSKLRELIQIRKDSGAEIVTIEDYPDHPLRKFVGCLRDEPLFDQWQQAIQDYREQIEREEATR